MPSGPEGYNPSEQEIADAEAHMSSKEKTLSGIREAENNSRAHIDEIRQIQKGRLDREKIEAKTVAEQTGSYSPGRLEKSDAESRLTEDERAASRERTDFHKNLDEHPKQKADWMMTPEEKELSNQRVEDSERDKAEKLAIRQKEIAEERQGELAEIEQKLAKRVGGVSETITKFLGRAKAEGKDFSHTRINFGIDIFYKGDGPGGYNQFLGQVEKIKDNFKSDVFRELGLEVHEKTASENWDAEIDGQKISLTLTEDHSGSLYALVLCYQ